MGRAALLAIVGLALSAPAADSYLYPANLGGSALSQYGLGPGGALSPKSPPCVQAQSFLAAAAVSPNGRSVYFADESNGYLLQYDVGAAGQLTPKPVRRSCSRAACPRRWHPGQAITRRLRVRVTHGGLRRIGVSTQALGRRAALRTFAVRGPR